MSSPRVALVAGLRTPFARRNGPLRATSALDLGVAVVDELIQRTGVTSVDRVIFGQVVPSLSTPNVARELVLASRLDPDTDAFSIARACTTSYQTTVTAAQAIAAGDIEVAIAGGTDSTSDIPMAATRTLSDALLAMDRARSIVDKVRAFREVSPRDLLPQPPALRERATGLTMGEHAERMAGENSISRVAQDDFAYRSHQRAAAAWADGRFADEVMTYSIGNATLREDHGIRARADRASYATLEPVFDRAHGTITAGSSSALTDGAAAILLMREDQAKALGHRPLAYLRSAAFTALDPHGQLLMGPAYAIPRALDRAHVRLSDIALVDLHEAFAAQVLSVTQALGSRTWAERHLGRGEATGEIEDDRLNVMGGSIAVGHPFAATGARQLVQAARELARRGGGLALCAACGAGGLGAAIVLEVEL